MQGRTVIVQSTEAKCVLSEPMMSALSSESQCTRVNDEQRHYILCEVVKERVMFEALPS